MRHRIVWVLVGILLATAAWASAPAAEPVTITVTDKTLVQDTTRIGINLCSDNYWDSAILKLRAVENFEGLRFRMVTWGPQIDEHGIYVWFRPTWEIEQSKSMAGKVRYTFLGGPDKGNSGMVKGIRTQVCPADQAKRELCYIEFDRSVTPAQANQLGVLLEYDKPDHGSMGHGSEPNWNSLENSVQIGDVPPGSFGQAALWLRGSEKEVYYNYAGAWRPMDEQNGTWHVRLWVKAKAGTPSFRVRMGGISGAGNQTIDLSVTETWKQHDLALEAKDVRADQNVGFELRCSGGDVLVDDVEIWKDEENRNATVFRDIVVDPLKKLHPGILRYLQMGGSDLETNLRPPLQQMPWTRDWSDLNNQGRNSGNIYPFNLHDFYLLCEHIGADPWYCIPGTLHPEEINVLMEYLGAPASVGYGKVRAELGHPQPWTEVFRNIYVEYGNEAWNSAGYATGSFNGPDHWKDMTAVGKASPHYSQRVVFVGGAQAGWPEIAQGVLENAPNLDRVAVAPYMLHSLTNRRSRPARHRRNTLQVGLRLCRPTRRPRAGRDAAQFRLRQRKARRTGHLRAQLPHHQSGGERRRCAHRGAQQDHRLPRRRPQSDQRLAAHDARSEGAQSVPVQPQPKAVLRRREALGLHAGTECEGAAFPPELPCHRDCQPGHHRRYGRNHACPR